MDVKSRNSSFFPGKERSRFLRGLYRLNIIAQNQASVKAFSKKSRKISDRRSSYSESYNEPVPVPRAFKESDQLGDVDLVSPWLDTTGKEPGALGRE